MHGFEHPRQRACERQRPVQPHWKEHEHHPAPHVAAYDHTAHYREAYVIVTFDKYCSLMETFHKPVMELMEYQELTADLKKGFAAQ